MRTSAMFARTPARKAMYESFYMRAVSPSRPVGVWIRHTAQKRAGAGAVGSVWCTVFDASRGRPFMAKLTSDALREPPDGWIAIGDGDDACAGGGGTIGPAGTRGACGGASWSLRTEPRAEQLCHLRRAWLYRAPLPRTKLTSPAPDARFDGSIRVSAQRELDVEDWRGMVGHNWGAEHAERWIWLHGVGFAEDATAWLDVALGRVIVGGRLTPWVANGAISLDRRRIGVGGLTARGVRVAETVEGCELLLPCDDGMKLEARVTVPPETAAGWRYDDPDGGAGHDVVNCSIARLELSVAPGAGGATTTLTSAHGGAYELGMRERDHGVPIAALAQETG
ncbi:MAG TPA: hypothetical protein VGH09_07025 [Solirubrobacteraceae bacterium]|jgi:hypothetical protein